MEHRTRITAVVLVGAALLALAPILASCGTSENDMRYLTTSPAIGLAISGHLKVVDELGAAVVSYLGGDGDLAALKQLVAPEAEDGLAEMLSSLSRPTGYSILGETAFMVDNDLYVDLLFRGGASDHDQFTVRILYDPGTGDMTITGIAPGPHGFE